MSDAYPECSLTATRSAKDRLWLLFWVSAVTLFLELALIRWVSTEVRIFAYLQSSVLVVCLLGMGMGCFASHRTIDLRRLFVPLGLIAALLAFTPTYNMLSHISSVLAQFGNFMIWGALSEQADTSAISALALFVVALLLTAMVLFLVWVAFIPLGQMVGRLIDGHDNTVTAYSVNIFGSFIGIALFTVLSAIDVAPVGWFSLLAIAFVAFAWRARDRRAVNIVLALLIPVLAWGSGLNKQGEVMWSPYQKLELASEMIVDSTNGKTYERRMISVNNTGYQSPLDLRPETTVQYPGMFDPKLTGISQYDLPTLFKPGAEHVLIVGAGSGNDAAGVLRGGAKHVTAVEIDPAIITLGKANHPEQPYADPRVILVNDDARSFMARTSGTYDLIVFGLLDSHTAGPMTNARLDHYVYTTENIVRAKALLKPGGVIVLAFEANKAFLIDRFNTTLTDTFGTDPLKFRIFISHYGFGGAFFVVGDQDVIAQALNSNPRLDTYIKDMQAATPMPTPGSVAPITDDWPYLYLEDRTIPALYGFLGVILLAIYLLSGRLVGLEAPLRGWRRGEWHFFFLGAAFMLLEVHMIAKSSVALGSVWTVNAVIIGGIMGMILLSNLIKAKVKRLPMRLVYGLLIGSCGLLYVADLSVLAALPYAQKVVVIAAVATLPMLFSGIVFINSFAAAPDKGRALGANLFGALVGGILQIVTFVSGIQFLMILVGALYLAAVLTVRRSQVEQPA